MAKLIFLMFQMTILFLFQTARYVFFDSNISLSTSYTYYCRSHELDQRYIPTHLSCKSW